MSISVPHTKEALDALCREANVTLPYAEDTSILKTPVTVQGRVIPNRIAYQAMEGCDGTPGGLPDTLTRRRYLRFARGGAGIIWFEATAVMKEGRANPRQLYMDEYNFMDFAPLVEEIKETCLRENGYEPTVIVQLTHSGRYSKPEGMPAPLIAYNNPIFEGNTPIDASRIVSDAYLDRLTEKLSFAAALAERAGFDGCDIKCCHRYLNSELLTFPLVFCGGSDLIYQCYIFFLKFVLRGRLNFPFYFNTIMMPEIVYTVTIALVLYQLLRIGNEKLCRLEKRSAKKFV